MLGHLEEQARHGFVEKGDVIHEVVPCEVAVHQHWIDPLHDVSLGLDRQHECLHSDESFKAAETRKRVTCHAQRLSTPSNTRQEGGGARGA